MMKMLYLAHIYGAGSMSLGLSLITLLTDTNGQPSLVFYFARVGKNFDMSCEEIQYATSGAHELGKTLICLVKTLICLVKNSNVRAIYYFLPTIVQRTSRKARVYL